MWISGFIGGVHYVSTENVGNISVKGYIRSWNAGALLGGLGYATGSVLHSGLGALASSVACAMAAGGSPLPQALQGGQANVNVYLGIRSGQPVYVGITNSLTRRQSEHGARFILQAITQSPVTRGQARAIEEALIVRNPHFENIRHAISPNHSYYQDALRWGEAWLSANGL